jgi:hypothetical protein
MIATKMPDIKKLINHLFIPLELILKMIGKKINQVPSNDENKKALRGDKKTSLFKKKKFEDVKNFKKPSLKEIYSFKGSGHNGKGKINRGAKTFNHPRKDLPSGRSH